jgi:alpha-L-fucosidase
MKRAAERGTGRASCRLQRAGGRGRPGFIPAGLATATAFMLAVAPARAAGMAQAEEVPRERLEAREWYRAARFGLFIHWGVYSLLGDGEWAMQNRSIPVASYEWLASTFNPVRFDAREWVALAKEAGVRYITITARHHDGFSMFGSAATRYDIMDWTRFGRDPLKELAAECERQGIRLFFYYSQLDWHHADYFPRGRTGRATGRPESGNWEQYVQFMDMQLEELLTSYGRIGGIWLDGMWDKPDADWKLSRTYALIHRLQPAALIVPNHHQTPLPGEDVQTFEQDLPGGNTAGFNTTTIGSLPLETSLTMNRSWGFNITDTAYKSVREIIHYLVRAAGNDANLLLNIGPRPDGTIQPAFVERLREVGRWLNVYGTSIYGTRGGPIPPRDWGVTTRRGDTVYVHVLDWKDPALAMPALDARVLRAWALATREPVDVVQSAESLTIRLGTSHLGDPDRVIVLETAGAGRAR